MASLTGLACGGQSLVEEAGGTGGDGGSVAGGSGGSGGTVTTGGTGATGGTVTTGGTGAVGATGGSGGTVTAGTGGSGATPGAGGSAGSGTGGTAAVGGAGAIGGVAGAAAVGGVPPGGMGGGAGSVAVNCVDPDVGMQGTAAWTVRATTTGENGSFTDTCDENGNLIEYLCETATCGFDTAGAVPAAGGSSDVGVPCQPITSRFVISTSVNCAGRCVEGACNWFCASQGDTLTVVEAPGDHVTFEDGGTILDCKPLVELGGFECLSPALLGHTMSVVSLGNCTAQSTVLGADDATTTPGEDCAYECIPRDGATQ